MPAPSRSWWSDWVGSALSGQPYFAGVFLTASSRDALCSHFPPTHSDVSADHVTLRYRPDLDFCRQLPLGKSVILHTAGCLSNSRIQVCERGLAERGVACMIQKLCRWFHLEITKVPCP